MFTLTAVKLLLKRGITVQLLCHENSSIHKEAIQAGFDVVTTTAKSYFHPLEIFKLSTLLRAKKFDLIHSQASKDLWLITPALKLSNLRTPLFLTKQVGSYIVKKDVFHKYIYSSVTIAFAISEVIKKNLLDTCPLTPEQIILLHNGIDLERFKPAMINRVAVRDELKINTNDIVLGMTSRFSWGKGHEEFLQALAGLKRSNQNIRGLIVGEASFGEQEYEKKIKSLATELKLDDIIYAGYRRDTDRMFAAMDIFVFPSHSEAFGIALVEAMAMGKPAVCSNSDGILDITVDSVTGFLFQKQSATDLEEKLRTLIASPELQITFGRNAITRVQELFDIEKLTDNTIEIYKRFVGA